MTKHLDETLDEQPNERGENTRSNDPADGDFPEIACTLTSAQMEQRKEWVEENLLPHLNAIEKHDDGFSIVFDRNPEAYAAVAEVAWKESQCCAWATFDVELPPGDGPIRWNARSSRAEGAAYFAEGLRETLQEFDGVPTFD